MGRKLDVGDRVICHLYNTPEKKFYGPLFEGTIIAIANITDRTKIKYKVTRGNFPPIWLQRKEIKRRIESVSNLSLSKSCPME